MFTIFDEVYMRQILRACAPEGETILAGVHGVTLRLGRKRLARTDIYVGLTARCLLVAACAERKALEGFCGAGKDGLCLSLEEIRGCTVKNSILGAVNCTLTLAGGSILKFQIPWRGGPGDGMPHHAEDREKILARLTSLPCAR